MKNFLFNACESEHLSFIQYVIIFISCLLMIGKNKRCKQNIKTKKRKQETDRQTKKISFLKNAINIVITSIVSFFFTMTLFKLLLHFNSYRCIFPKGLCNSSQSKIPYGKGIFDDNQSIVYEKKKKDHSRT